MIDTIGGAKHLLRSYRALRKGGRLVWLGSSAVEERGLRIGLTSLLMLHLLKLIPDGKRAPSCPTIAKYALAHNDWYRGTLSELLDSLAAGRIRPVIAERIPLAEAGRAHELLERGGHTGKLVLVTRS